MRGAYLKALVFLGGGRITSALIAGLRLGKYQQQLIVHDRNPAKLKALRKQYRVSIEPDLRKAVAQAKLLVIAVRPDAVRALLSSIRPQHKACAISLAAGIPLRNLRLWISNIPWVRAMPSPAARFGKGLTALAFGPGLPRSLQDEVSDLFSRVGEVVRVPEARFDAFTVTYSTSHGYHALAALAQAAEKLGLDRETALMASAHALADGILAWREAKVPLDKLLDESATPGGIAATVMRTMDDGGYRKTIERGLRTGLARTRANAKR
jgi:pyrroline-5-carboxylate reductase